MKAESNISPNTQYEFEIHGDNVNITLFDNIVKMEADDGTPKYVYDVYYITVINRPGLISDLDNSINKWIIAARDSEYNKMAATIREKRDLLLSATDYLMTQDYPISVSDRLLIAEYRQALRDIPEQNGFPFDVMFPIKPKTGFKI